MTERTEPVRQPRGQGDDGAALVEFAFVMILLFTLIFGIITFGLLLSFKQDMTRAAAEGARAGAVEFPATGAWAAANSATSDAVKAFGGTFSTPGCARTAMDCNVNLHDCAVPVTPGTPSNPSSVGDCVTVELVYTYGDDPLFGDVPGLTSLLDSTVVKSTSVARINQ